MHLKLPSTNTDHFYQTLWHWIIISIMLGAVQCAFRNQIVWIYCYMSRITLRWRHNGHDCVLNHQPRHCLLNRLFERRSKKTSKLRVTGLCVGNSPETGEFPAQMASNAENISIWWRHHDTPNNSITTCAYGPSMWHGNAFHIIGLLRGNPSGIVNLNRLLNKQPSCFQSEES